MVNIYLSVDLVSVLALSVLWYMTFHNDVLQKRMKQMFLLSVSAIMVVVFAEIGTYLFGETITSSPFASMFFNAVGFSVSPMIPILISLAFCNNTTILSKLVWIPVSLNCVITLLSPWLGLIFRVSPQNHYERGAFFLVYVVTYIFSMLTLFRETCVITKRYPSKNRFTPVLLFLFLLIGTTLQLCFPELHTTWLSANLAVTIYYAYFCELSEKYDVLTNLFNRRAYECAIEQLNHGDDAFIMVLDVDHFKGINDTFGHQYGDKCLSWIADLLRATFYNVGLCYRTGGDEFSIICKESQEQAALHAIERFNAKLNLSRKAHPDLPTVTFGFVRYDKEESICDAILSADKDLYANKKTRI